MVPTLQTNAPNKSDAMDRPSITGDEVVISGISGLFPNSDNVVQFMENLYDKVNMVQSEKPSWNFKHPDMPDHLGKVNDINKFDAQFFKVPHRQCAYLDGMICKVLEQAYGAIFDAGINPSMLAGTKVGVFVGSSYCDTANVNLFDASKHSSYVMIGCTKNHLANRISYWLDGKTSSYALDSTCSSSTVCLYNAYWSIRNGYCDTAIVAGCNHCILPVLSVNMKRAGLLCLDGKTKCFDKNGDGYVRSEACNVVFLQRAKDAKRVYLEVCYVKTKYFNGPDDNFLPIRRTEDIERFLKEFYSEANVSPDDIEYVEASAPGIAKADGNELEAIGRFFGKNKIVKVGCVKSNMGHSEGASGICAVTKICLAYYTGKVPGNLHYKNPQDHIPAIRDGKVQVLTEELIFNRGYVALNSFSYSGVNVHVLMKGHYKPKNTNKYKTSLPRLIVASGRTESCLKKLFDRLRKAPVDAEQIRLLHDIFNCDISSHTARGYMITRAGENNNAVNMAESVQYYSGSRRPVWFLYSGMGSQWPEMGAELMQIPIFASAVNRCHHILESKGIDVIKILTEPDEHIFDNILNCFVGIAAVQIGLTDVLTELGIIPDNIIGHSVGETGCAYADGSFNTEEVMLSSYARGLVSIKSKFIFGSMAAIGLGYKNLKKICPPEIEVACHNSSQSCTISGPAENVNDFVNDMRSRGIFAKKVNTSNIPYHSKYIAGAGPEFLSTMSKFIVNPKPRSEKWVSTSVPPDYWCLPESKYCSAAYFTNNFLNPVYFEEAASRIPSNAIVIEISPHGLMQAILKRSHEGCVHVPLTKRNNRDPVRFLLKSIGTLYEAGLNPKIDVLYPKIEWPVSTETSILSHLVEWDHSKEWPLAEFKKLKPIVVPAREVIISIHDDEWNFIKRYFRNGVNVIPESVFLVLVWQTLGMFKGINYIEMNVVFKNIRFHREVIANAKDIIRLYVSIHKEYQDFEISYEDSTVASGVIEIAETPFDAFDSTNIDENTVELESRDIYSILNLRGLSYRDEFQLIHSYNLKSHRGQIKWTGEWITFLDSIFQLSLLGTDCRGVSSPKHIKEMIINTNRHSSARKMFTAVSYAPREYNQYCDILQCGGVQIRSAIFSDNLLEEPKVEQFLVSIKRTTGNIKNVCLISTAPGDFDRLAWVQVKDVPVDSPKANSVKVLYAGLSLRDCNKAAGYLSTKNEPLGMDYSGINWMGDRVMGIVPHGALTAEVGADPDLMWPVPDHWTSEEAATVPIPYALAYYCLMVRNNVKEHRKVLVTGGAGALGQAMISLCLALNCTLYVTVSDIRKKQFIMKMFPELKDENIINSRTLSFFDLGSLNVKKYTFDYVINCGNPTMWKKAVQYLGRPGIYVDTTDYSSYENEDYGMWALDNDKSHQHVKLSNVFKHLDERKKLQYLIAEGISKGVVKPISWVIYPPEDATKAFRLLSRSKNRGRVLITMGEILSPLSKINVLPRLILSEDKSYIVISDATGVGIQLVDRLIERGATKIILHHTTSGYLDSKCINWRENDKSVAINSDNLNDEGGWMSLLQKSNCLSPVQGMYIVGNSFFNVKENDKCACDNNTTVAKNIDNLIRTFCPELSHFIFINLSSTNKSNKMTSLFEEICKIRKNDNLPATILQNELMEEYLENYDDLLMNIQPKELSKILNDIELSLIGFSHSNGCDSTETQESVNWTQNIDTIMGWKLNDVEDDLTLKNLGMNEITLLEIKYQIRKNLQEDISVKQLKYMTISSLKTKINDNFKTNITMKSGLDAFYTYIDDDVCAATEPIAIMTTKLNMIDKLKEELNPSDTFLLMLPGFEGHGHIFTSLCERLKVQAMAIQFGPDFLEETIPDLAKNITKRIKGTIKLKSKFYVLGYSFGVDVALEVAALMEKEGHIGTVYCLDSSPDALKIQLNAHIGNIKGDELQNTIIAHMYRLITGRQGDDITKELINFVSWEEKIDFCIKEINGFVSHSKKYIKSIIHGAYKRISAAQMYEPHFKLKSEIILIKGIPHPRSEYLAPDYNLSKYTKQPVKVFEIEANHSSAPQDYRVANIINRFLDQKLIEEFHKMNLCESYT